MDLATLLSQVQGILSPQSSTDQGLLGQVLAPYGGATNVGLNLLANGGPSPVPRSFGQIVGQSALQAQQIAQQSQTNALQRQLMAMSVAQNALGLQQALTKQGVLTDAYGNPTGQPVSQPSAVPPSAAPSAAPANQPPPLIRRYDTPPQFAAPTQAAQPDPLAVPDVSSMPIGNMDPQTFKRLEIFGYGKDPGEVEKTARELQLQSAQRAVAPQLAAFDNVIKSDSPTRVIQSDPDLLRVWAQVAPSFGINANTGLTDSNARTVFGLAGNRIRGQVGLPTEAPIVPLQTVPTGLGGSYQRDTVTGKISPGAPQQETDKFVMPDGTVKELTKAEGVARGLTPFTPSIFGASNVSDQALQFAADTYRTTGKWPANFSRNLALQGKALNLVAKDAAANGDTAGSIAARTAALKANGMALDQNQKLLTATTGYAATLDKNLTSLLASYKKVDSSGSPLINRAFRAWQQGVSGDPQTAAMVTWLNAAQGEYAKLKSGNLGNAPASDAAMKDAREVINKYMNQGGMQAVADAMRAEAKNRISAIQEASAGIRGELGQSAPGITPTPNGANGLSPSDSALLKKWGG